MPLIEEKFDQHKIDSLKRYLQREMEKNRPKDFEIIVDGFKIVSRTENVEEFEDYEQEIKDSTRNISILIFDGPGTNRNTRYSFSLHGEPGPRQNQPANGLGEIDQVIAQKLEEREREHAMSHLKEKLSATEAKLTESEEYAETLQKRIKDMEEKRYVQAVSIGEVASVVLKTLVKQHAARIPGGQALAGLLGADLPEDAAVAELSAPQGAASFEKQSAADPLDEQTRNRLSLIEQLQQRFDEQQMVAVFSILDCLTAAPDKIELVLIQLGLQPAPAITTE